MRVAIAFLLAGTMWSGGAEASSIVTPAPMTDAISPSMIVLDEAGTATPDLTIAPKATAADAGGNPGEIKLSASMIALGEPGVATEKVASIGSGQGARRDRTPMVIRGGLIGDALIPAAAAQPPISDNRGATPPAAEQPSKTASSGEQPVAPAAATPPPSPMIRPE